MITREEISRLYPPGTKYIPINSDFTSIDCIQVVDTISPSGDQSEIWWGSSQAGFVYIQGKFAKIVNENFKINYLVL